jgi:transposase
MSRNARTRQVTVNKIICGVDVSKAHLDCGFETKDVKGQFANTADGIAKLVGFCRQHNVMLVVMEATGGCERLAFGLLWQEGIACSLANPRNVRQFAGAMGILEKTDSIDARVIAQFARVKDLKPMPPESQKQSRLKALSIRLRQVVQDRVANMLRRTQAQDGQVCAMIDEHLALLMRQERILVGELASLIDDDPLWQRLAKAFREIKGVADRTVARLLAELPEIGIYDNKAIAKLAGLAPLADDSGKHHGKRSIRGGRDSLRSTLFIITIVVRKHDKTMAAFAATLAAKGKPKMVIRIAMARKLLVWLNAKARDARMEFANAT